MHHGTPYDHPDLSRPSTIPRHKSSFAEELAGNLWTAMIAVFLVGAMSLMFWLVGKEIWEAGQEDPAFKMWTGIFIITVCVVTIGVIVYTMISRRLHS